MIPKKLCKDADYFTLDFFLLNHVRSGIYHVKPGNKLVIPTKSFKISNVTINARAPKE